MFRLFHFDVYDLIVYLDLRIKKKGWINHEKVI